MQHYLTLGPYQDHKLAHDQADWLERRGFCVVTTRKLGKDGKARTTVRAYRSEGNGRVVERESLVDSE